MMSRFVISGFVAGWLIGEFLDLRSAGLVVALCLVLWVTLKKREAAR